MQKLFLLLILPPCGLLTVLGGLQVMHSHTERLVALSVSQTFQPILRALPRQLPETGTVTRQDVGDLKQIMDGVVGLDSGLNAVSLFNLAGERVFSLRDPLLHSGLPDLKGVRVSPTDSIAPALAESLELGSDETIIQSALAGHTHLTFFPEPTLLRPPKTVLWTVPILRADRVIGALAFSMNVGGLWKEVSGVLDRLLLIIGASFVVIMSSSYFVIVHRRRRRQKAERRLLFLEEHDAMTGLANRNSYLKDLEESIDLAEARNRRIGVMHINVDHFGDFNATFGREIGDALICTIALHLRRTLQREDRLFRIGGGEFAAVVESQSSKDDLRALAEIVINTIGSISRILGQRIRCTASVAVAIAPEQGHNSENLTGALHLALERARGKGRSSLSFYEPKMDMESRRRKQLEQDLRSAITRQELMVLYQPQFDLLQGQVIGMEALLRWNHPSRARVGPGEFIPIAEESRLIIEIGEWVLTRACQDALEWPEPVRVAVNLSPSHFDGQNVALMIADVLDQTGLPPQRLEVEITENLLISNTRAIVDTLTNLSAMGVRIAMDDFGVGYSSLATLSRFKFHKIKIDQSFTNLIGRRTETETIVQFIVSLGKSLGVDVLAEGVENRFQIDKLVALGCSKMQGYSLGTPKPQTDVMSRLQGERYRIAPYGHAFEMRTLA